MPLLFEDHNCNRHMPYIYEGNKLLFCVAPFKEEFYELQGVRHPQDGGWAKTRTAFRPYQLFMADLDLENQNVSNTRPMGRHHDNNNVYCSPSAYRHRSGSTVMTYTMEGVERTGANYYLAYKRRSQELMPDVRHDIIKNTLGMKAYCVAENETYRVVAKVMNQRAFVVIFNKATLDEKKVSIGGISFLRRISFISGTDKLLLTFPTGSGHFLDDATIHNTHIWNLQDNTVEKVLSDDKSLYKCTIFNDNIIYSFRDTKQENYWMDLKIAKYVTMKSKLRINENFCFNRGTGDITNF